MTDTGQHAPTRVIQSAVKGREYEILDAVEIDWRKGRPHICCPYPDHEDAHPSWRWNAKKARAYCTCLEGSDSIFDVVMKMRGGDFEAAKLFVANAINRDDLIREPHTAGRIFPSTAPESLLAPPPANRDDGLVTAYLALRLGVAMEAMPLPQTPFVGWKALPYFDPPPHNARRNAKLKHVGDFPCAVFGTVSADGGRHAHRIYLAPGGAGKAELGTNASGQRRNSKKSAKAVDGDNTAGRAVLWGDSERAPWIILCEGIETGAALAHVFADEIEAGLLTVAAGVSASGVEAFQPYSCTQRITVAADRDEAPKPNVKPGSRRGEQAARRFALRHHERLKIAIALPGAAGERVDFLDVLRRDGAEAARAAIEGARPFRPTRAEVEEQARAMGRAVEVEETANLYPLPQLDNMELVYKHTETGRVKVHRARWELDPRTGRREKVLIPVATPFGVPARLRHADQANAYGLRVAIQDMDGQPRAVDVNRASFAKRGASDVLSELYAAGLRTESDGETLVVQYLKAADPDQEIVVVQRPGWHELGGLPDPVFIAPDGTAIGAPEDCHLELAAAARMAPDVATGGSLDGWRAASEAAVSVSGCEHWTIGVIAAFVGPLVSLTGLETCGIHLSGISTSGKSTAQRLAVSAWSSPDIRRPGLYYSARATDNAIEALAYRASSTVLSLDELAHVQGKEAGRMIYTIAGGAGKRRMTAEAIMRESYTWSTFAILSGENSLAEKITRDGGDWSAGMAVRIVDVDVTGVNRTVDGATLDRIEEIQRHYGHAGPAFVRGLIESSLHRQAAELRERVLGMARELAGDNTESATLRAAMPFALLFVAGELAKKFGLVPQRTEVQHAVTWAWKRFRQSLESLALSPDEQAVTKLREYVSTCWNVTIKSVDTETGGSNREAVGWYDESAIYLLSSTIGAASGHVLNERHVGAALAARQLLARSEPGRHTVRYVPKVGHIRAYALKRSEFGPCEGSEPPPSTDND